MPSTVIAVLLGLAAVLVVIRVMRPDGPDGEERAHVAADPLVEGRRGGMRAGSMPPAPRSDRKSDGGSPDEDPETLLATADAVALATKLDAVAKLQPDERDRRFRTVIDDAATLRVLTPELVVALRGLLMEVDPALVDYSTSVLEQQGGPESVGLLADLVAGHPDEDVRLAARMALEGVAGEVFETEAEAIAWARSPQPDPEPMPVPGGDP